MNYLKYIIFTLLLVGSYSFAFAAQITPVSPITVAAAPAVQNSAAAPAVQDIYQDGLIATMYTEDPNSGTWASAKVVGTALGEFVDAKTPILSFANIKQEQALWSIYPSAHVGVEWNGFFHAEEAGKYVFGLKASKKMKTSLHINSYVAKLQLGGKTLVDNSIKLKAENYYWNSNERLEKSKYNSVTLKSGYYPIKIWIHCGVTKGEWDNWVTDDFKDISWALQIKRPSDRVIGDAPTGTLVWK
ncbi:MAG: hypothetical protein BA863_07700 [Desulfovibrio sp. S3730MH75]|nr:MAG: hypothetical protein BA863_07700 [Desulfovibrio sp. S3730MH75]